MEDEIAAMEIYVGAPIEYESERSVLRKIERLLTDDRRSAIVFANISINSRQIDFVLALDGLVLVIEAKGYSRPVQGGENGPWQVKVASGDWKDIPNLYAQTLNARYAVKDGMHSFCRAEVPYPAAALVFVPDIPRGSQIDSGDFKVSVIGEDGLCAALRKRGENAWSSDQWREFANHLGLTRVPSVSGACDAALAEAESLLRRYTEAFRRTYKATEPLVPFPCRLDGEEILSEEIARLVSEQHADLLIRGPSGCGKSMVAASSGIEFSRQGGIVITIQVKEYTGSLKTVLNSEAGLLAAPSAAQLLNAARRLNRPILFIVDGYNECAEKRRSSLTRGLAALAQRYEARLLVTSQIPLERDDLLALHTIEVPAATMETKSTIAKHASGYDVLPGEITYLLGAISTGLEAKLIGEVGREHRRGSSRYALFDAFARKRLGESASDGIRFLSQLAAWLFDRFAFSLSVRDLDRLMEDDGLSPALPRQLEVTGLLTQRGDRVSFTHEMFFDAFAAEAVVRRAAGQAEAVLTTLDAPVHAARKDLIIGAIDDSLFLEQLLPRLADHASVAACLSGSCGRRAQEWVKAYCLNLLSQLRDEARHVRFQIDEQGRNNVAFQRGSLTIWNPLDRVFFAVLPRLISEGHHLDEILEIIGLLDQRIADEWTRLRDEARSRNISLRSALFACSYVSGFSPDPGITSICADLYGRLFQRRNVSIERKLMGDDLSPGQLYLLLILSRGTDGTAPLLTRIIEEHWNTAPYHLRLSLMDAVFVCRPANEADRAALIEAIEALPPQHPFLSSSIVDALKSLGALEDSEREHCAAVRREIRQCLSQQNEIDNYAKAWGIYSAQFDHPLSGAYCEVVSTLPDHDQKTLLTMAAKGATESSFFLSPLLIDLASFGDPSVGGSIVRWTVLPPTDSPMPQEAVRAFVLVHIVLARLGCALPDRSLTSGNASAAALTACGLILYWSNRTDLDKNTKAEACYPSLGLLVEHRQDATLDILRICEDARMEGVLPLPGDAPVIRSIVGRFPTEMADICRHALRKPEGQIGYFRHFSEHHRHQNLSFAIDVLARHGNSTDSPLLRRYASDPTLGTDAIKALQSMEERLTGKPKVQDGERR